MLEASATAAGWRRPRSGSCPGIGGCLTSADPVERGPAPLLPLRRPHGPTSPPGPTFRSCSPDRVDSRRPLDRLDRYENDCTARACLALLSRSANSGYEAHTSLGAGAGVEGRRRARRRPRHLRRHPAERPQPATGQPLPRARAPTGRTASWPRPPTPSRARAGCGRPPSGWASTATPQSCLRLVGPAGAGAAGGLAAQPLPHRPRRSRTRLHPGRTARPHQCRRRLVAGQALHARPDQR